MQTRNIELPVWAENSLLIIIILFYFIVALRYALITPAFEASDELWHYPMIQHLANGNRLPVQTFDPATAGPWKQEASQPPLYYYLGAALTFWVDTSDFQEVRKLNPHVDTGIITTDGNTNLAVHKGLLNPNRGTLLAVRIVRLFSVLLGAATVYLTYLIGREVAPNRPDISLVATGLTAFTPMFLFITGSVNNDNLAIPLASLGVLLLIRLVNFAKSAYPQMPVPWRKPVNLLHENLVRRLLLIGVVTGLAVLTKQGTIGLIPLAWGSFFIVGWLSTVADHKTQNQTFSDWASQIGSALARSLLWFAIFFFPILLIAGWWYGRNIILYGDLLGWSAFEAVLGIRETEASIGQLWDERWGFMLSYWGLFGGLNVPMDDWIYRIMTGVLIISVPGGIWYIIRKYRASRWWRQAFKWPNTYQKIGTGIINLVVSRFALTVCLLFSFAIIYGLIQWATRTWSSQGRLVFTAFSTLNVLFAAGLCTVFQNEYVKHVKTGILIFFAFISFYAPVWYIEPAYKLPALFENGVFAFPWVSRFESEEDAIFDETILLAGAAIDAEDLEFTTGEIVPIALDWKAKDFNERDWSVFVHLNDPVLGIPVAQRDMYMSQGLTPTSFMFPPRNYPSRFDVRLSNTMVAPAQLDVIVGLYDFATGERATLPNGEDHIIIGTVNVVAREGETPNPVRVNFENKFELIGYQIEPRRVSAGDTVTVTAYWRSTARISTDYTFFGQFVGDNNTRWAAVDLGQPTTTWQRGDIQEIKMEMNLQPDTPPGVYPLRLGIYSFEDGAFTNLQRVTEDDRLTDDFINLTVIRVE
ncbi:MAG: glycosyltransferase family 39 protein [Chloroflexota bacterium]